MADSGATKAAKPFLPYGRQQIDDSDIAAVAEVLRSDWLTTGPAVEAFESAFAAVTGAKHAVACANGTAALHLAALALGLGPGDRVVVPSITFLATANAPHQTGAEIVFADVDADTGLLTPALLEEAIARAGGPVQAVFPVHLAGQSADMDGISEVARQAGAQVVEDACHSLGGRDAAGAPVGGCRRAGLATFSLHPVKIIAAGEGGVVTTNSPELAASLRRMRNHGMVRDGFAEPWFYEMQEPGFNYRLSDIHAALAHSQLRRLNDFVARRQALMERYERLLAPLAPLVRPIPRVAGTPAWHLNAVLIDFDALGLTRSDVMEQLRDSGVGSQVHYIPVHRQPYYRERYGALDLPGAESWYSRALSLPLFPSMTDSDVDRVVETLAALVPEAAAGSAPTSAAAGAR